MLEGLDRRWSENWKERAVVLALSSRFPTSAGEQCQKMRLDELRRISQRIQLKSPPSAPWQKVSSGIDTEAEKQNLAAVEEGTAARLQELARERAEAERMHEEWMQESHARIERMKAETEAEVHRVESARQTLRATHIAKGDSAFHSEVSSNTESTKQHREEEGENNLTPCDDSVDAKGEASWIDSLVVPSLSAMRKHSFQRSSRPLQPEKHQKLPARLRRAFGFILRDRTLLHILAVVVMTKAGRKNGRISKRSAESPTESPCAKPVHLVSHLRDVFAA